MLFSLPEGREYQIQPHLYMQSSERGSTHLIGCFELEIKEKIKITFNDLIAKNGFIK